MDISLDANVLNGGTELTIPSDKLSEGTSYLMVLTTYARNATGGTTTINIKTGGCEAPYIQNGAVQHPANNPGQATYVLR